MSNKEPNVEVNAYGIKCDNPECDYKDMTVQVEDYPKWVDKPCPKCGQNLLTKEDYFAVKQFLAIAELVNQMSKEDIDAVSEQLGMTEEEANKRVRVEMNIHNGQLDIKKIEDDNGEDEIPTES